jgi:hypothetical protein
MLPLARLKEDDIIRATTAVGLQLPDYRAGPAPRAPPPNESRDRSQIGIDEQTKTAFQPDSTSL